MKTAVGICFRNLLQVRFLLFAAVFLFAIDGWGGCYSTQYIPNSVLSACPADCVGASANCVDGPYAPCSGGFCRDAGTSLVGTKYTNDGLYCFVESVSQFSNCWTGAGSCGNCGTSFTSLCCNDKCESDSIACYKAGKLWDSQNCNCSDICQGLEKKCNRAGGTFTGRALNLGSGNTCCSAICDQCNTEANDKIVELKRKYCCEAGFAPPEEGKNCYSPPGISGCGMTTLQRMTSTLDYQCRDPNSSEEAANAYYDQCFPGSSSSGEGGSSSSGEGGSSSGGSNYPEGCDECPWLDSILDTLTLLKWNSDDMLQCIVNPSVCTTSPDEQGTQVDSVILEGVKERLDSVVARLRSNDTGLRKLDTSLLKLLDSLGKSIRQDSLKRRLDSAMAVAGLKNDTMIRNAIADAGASVDGNLVKLRNTTDTNLVKLRDGVFELDTGMKHHLDSIIAHLPDTILDSIRKYQDSTLDRIDTALFGAGVGFSLVDSMIDTVVKYFRVSNHYDSVYNQMFASFDSTFKYKMENLEMSIESDYSALGYGDTATSTLRKDLGSMEGAITGVIENLDSSVKHELQNLLEGQKAYYTGATGYGDTATSTLRGDLNGIRGSVDSLNSKLGQGSYDTNSTFDGYLGGYDTAAVQFASNLGSALSGALADSTYKGIFVLNSSSSGSNDDYRLIDIDSAQAVLKASNDSTKSALADTMQTWFNELRNDFMLVNFDSAIIAPLGAKVPNTNTCPEECFKIDLSGAGGAFSDVKGFSWGLCDARIGNMNVLQFIRLILRIVTALTCVYIGLWFISGRKS